MKWIPLTTAGITMSPCHLSVQTETHVSPNDVFNERIPDKSKTLLPVKTGQGKFTAACNDLETSNPREAVADKTLQIIVGSFARLSGNARSTGDKANACVPVEHGAF